MPDLWKMEGSGSAYAVQNQNIIRVSNHSANAENFKKHADGEKYDNIISIVLEKGRKRKHFEADEDVDAVEFVFSQRYIDQNNALSMLVHDIGVFLATGEYIDHVGAVTKHFSGSQEFIRKAKEATENNSRFSVTDKEVSNFIVTLDGKEVSGEWDSVSYWLAKKGDISAVEDMLKRRVENGIDAEKSKEDLEFLRENREKIAFRLNPERYFKYTDTDFKAIDPGLAEKLFRAAYRGEIAKGGKIEIDGTEYTLDYVSRGDGSESYYFRTGNSIVRISDHWSKTPGMADERKFNVGNIRTSYWGLADADRSKVFSPGGAHFDMIGGIADLDSFRDRRPPKYRYSLKRTPQSVDDYREMPAHPRPEKAKFHSVKELYDIYKREYLGQTIRTISGHDLTFNPGHFFRLIAGTPKNGVKGWISKAKNASDAIRMIEAGEVDFSDIAGYQQMRAEHMNLFRDIVTDGDFWKQNGDKVFFGKKYAGLKDADGFLGVTITIENNQLGTLSFSPRIFSDKILSGDLHWNVKKDNPPVGSTPDGVLAHDIVEERLHEITDTVHDNTEKSSAGSKNNSKFSITAEQDTEYLDAVKRGDMETARRMVNEAAEQAGYSANSDYQGSLAFNGAAPSKNGYYDTKEERKAAWEAGEYEGDFSLGDYMDNGIDTHDLEWRINNPAARYNEPENVVVLIMDGDKSDIPAERLFLREYRCMIGGGIRSVCRGRESILFPHRSGVPPPDRGSAQFCPPALRTDQP